MDNFPFRELGQPNFTDSQNNRYQKLTPTTTNNGLDFYKESSKHNNISFQGGGGVGDHGSHVFTDHTAGQRIISFQSNQFNNSNLSGQGYYNTTPFPTQHGLGSFQFRTVIDPSPPPPLISNYELNNNNNKCSVLRVSSSAPTSGFLNKDSVELRDIPDIPDTCFNYISELLRDDNPYDQPLGTLQDYMAYQAVYQSFTDTLSSSNNNNNNNTIPGNEYFSGNQIPISSSSSPAPPHHYQQQQDPVNPSGDGDNHPVGSGSIGGGSSHGSNSCRVGGVEHDYFCIEDQSNHNNNSLSNCCRLESSLADFPLLQQALLPTGLSSLPAVNLASSTTSQLPNLPVADNINIDKTGGGGGSGTTSSKSRARTSHLQGFGLDDRYYFQGGGRGKEETEEDESRRNKQQSKGCLETYGQISEYEEDLFCPEDKPSLCNVKKPEETQNNQEINKNNSYGKKGVRGTKGSSKTKKQTGGRRKTEVVDLAGLLILCSESIARMDFNSAREQLKQIRQHSSPIGDNNIKRLAYYFANAIEARLSGGGGIGYLSGGSGDYNVSSTDFLKANRIYVAAVPFQIMSYYVANKTIAGLTMESNRIHIIDFGIGYGLQWPCIISNLAKKEPCPPRIRITGVDFPEKGMRPMERVDETGRCLGRYCERFGVPFEYKGIVVGSWEEVRVEELGIEEGEMVVVNCLYRGHELYDESVDLGKGSPRDEFLRLVRRIEPDYFMHGVVNGSFSAPYFAMRFKEALSYYGALFDVFEATMPRGEMGEEERVVLEEKVVGMRVMNVVACEGKERVERPESYRRWRVRMEREGFKQMDIDGELLKRGKAMVGNSFRKEFLFGEENQWAVQGWKGKILYAISCWRPDRRIV